MARTNRSIRIAIAKEAAFYAKASKIARDYLDLARFGPADDELTEQCRQTAVAYQNVSASTFRRLARMRGLDLNA